LLKQCESRAAGAKRAPPPAPNTKKLDTVKNKVGSFPKIYVAAVVCALVLVAGARLEAKWATCMLVTDIRGSKPNAACTYSDVLVFYRTASAAALVCEWHAYTHVQAGQRDANTSHGQLGSAKGSGDKGGGSKDGGEGDANGGTKQQPNVMSNGGSVTGKAEGTESSGSGEDGNNKQEVRTIICSVIQSYEHIMTRCTTVGVRVQSSPRAPADAFVPNPPTSSRALTTRNCKPCHAGCKQGL